MKIILKLRLYRPLMRLAHRFGWHYAPAQPLIDVQDRFEGARHWCQWCGLRGRVYASKIGAPITIQRPVTEGK